MLTYRHYTPTLMYVAADGSYGDATGLTLVNVTEFTNDDYEALELHGDADRADFAADIAHSHDHDETVWAWMTKSEATQVLRSLSEAVELLIRHGCIGTAEEVGDMRDVLHRSGIGR